MSDYYGDATLSDWLAEEVFQRADVPKEVTALFEKWREDVEGNIQAWMDSDDGEGRTSWRGWGRGFYAVPESDRAEFDEAVRQGQAMLVR